MTGTTTAGSPYARLRGLLLGNSRVVFTESVLLLLVVWAIATEVFGMADVLSSPILVAPAMYEIVVTGEAWPHFVASFRRILYAFAFTMVVGVAVGLVMGLSEFWKQVLQYYVLIGLALPSLFASIFAAIWFGLSDVTPMVATAILTFPFISESVRESIEDLDSDLIEMSASFDVSRGRTLRRVVIQSVMPALFGSARFAFSVAWKITTLTEVIIADSGIGFTIRFFMSRLDITGVLKYVLLFTVVILVIEYGVFRKLEEVVFDWRQGVTISFGGVA